MFTNCLEWAWIPLARRRNCEENGGMLWLSKVTGWWGRGLENRLLHSREGFLTISADAPCWAWQGCWKPRPHLGPREWELICGNKKQLWPETELGLQGSWKTVPPSTGISFVGCIRTFFLWFSLKRFERVGVDTSWRSYSMPGAWQMVWMLSSHPWRWVLLGHSFHREETRGTVG